MVLEFNRRLLNTSKNNAPNQNSEIHIVCGIGDQSDINLHTRNVSHLNYMSLYASIPYDINSNELKYLNAYIN
jgi:hypothetical protein